MSGISQGVGRGPNLFTRSSKFKSSGVLSEGFFASSGAVSGAVSGAIHKRMSKTT